MTRVIVVTTREHLNKPDPEKRVWHGSYSVLEKESLCGETGDWAGAGLMVTCLKCSQIIVAEGLNQKEEKLT